MFPILREITAQVLLWKQPPYRTSKSAVDRQTRTNVYALPRVNLKAWALLLGSLGSF